MKKIYCDMAKEDYLYVRSDEEHAYLHSVQDSRETEIALSPAKIRKLRKQLKRALVEIEGEPKKADEGESNTREEGFRDEKIEFKPDDRVYLLPWDNECHLTSPAAQDIDFGKPVVLTEFNIRTGLWSFKYMKLDGITQSTGFAYEKSFGRRA